MTNKHMKRCSMWLTTREIQIETTMNGISLHTFRMAKMKKSDHIQFSDDVAGSELSYTACGNVKWYNHSGRQSGSLS